MNKYRCNTCEGEYSDTGGGELPYYHACAPVQVRENEHEERADKRDENAGKKLGGKGRTKTE